MRTGAPRPATARSPSICGRLARRRDVEVGAAAARGEGDGGDGAAEDQRPAPALVIPRDFGPAGSRGIRRHFAFDWLATASAAFFAASGSPR